MSTKIKLKALITNSTCKNTLKNFYQTKLFSFGYFKNVVNKADKTKPF